VAPREVAEKALRHVRETLAAHGLRLNPEGTRIADFDDSVRFLGHLFVRSLALKEVEVGDEDEGSRLPPPDLARELTAEAGRPDDEGSPPDELPGEPRGARAPGLRVLYVREPRRRLVRVNEAFGVEEDGELIFAVQPGRVDRIELGPEVEPDAKALRHALAEAVPLTFVDGRGRTLGTLEPRPTERAKLHLAQATLILDPEARLGLARRLVAGRLFNQRSLLRRLNRRRKNPEVAKAAHDIGRLIRLLDRQPDMARLMGVEGRAGALYWPGLGRCLERGWTLTYRRRQPPPDPVNLAISYLASMLTRDITALAMRRGLHTGFGVLHETQDARHALALDLVEEFRAPLVEGLAVYLFNNRVLKAEMFDQKEGAVRLWAIGTKALIRGYEAWLDRSIESPRTRDRIGWRRLIDEQIVAYGAHALGRDAYACYALDH
jgi:CRISPR-associated protein Cas1